MKKCMKAGEKEAMMTTLGRFPGNQLRHLLVLKRLFPWITSRHLANPRNDTTIILTRRVIAAVMRLELRQCGRAGFRMGSGHRMGQRENPVSTGAVNLSDHEHDVQGELKQHVQEEKRNIHMQFPS